MKITVYTITDCPFCKQEKDFLTAQGLQFEEKNVQENREFLTEMLQVSDKFAGVPFTMIEKDTGEKVGLKGFTQSEFETALGLTVAGTSTMASAPVATDPASMTPPVAAPDPTTMAPDPTPTPEGDIMGEMPGSTTSSMPDAAPNMPSMPGIDEAPAATPAAPQTAPSMPVVPSVPSEPAATEPTAPTEVAPANPQNQLDGLLADLQSKSQPDLPDFNAPASPAAPASSDTSTQQQ